MNIIKFLHNDPKSTIIKELRLFVKKFVMPV